MNLEDGYWESLAATIDDKPPAAEPEQKDRPPAYELVWYGDITQPAHYQQVVDDLLLEGSFGVIYGESNCGKTFFILDLALAVAQGIAWRGRGTRKGMVIYVAGEGASSVMNRVLGYRKTRPFVDDASPFAVLPNAVDFMDFGSVQKLKETIKQASADVGQSPALVVIDTLARAMSGEENSTQDMGMVVAAADMIRKETGACVCFVHHTGKDASKGARGSSALRAATDTEIQVEGTKGPRTVTVQKQRDLDVGEKMVFDLTVIEIGTNEKNGKAITTCTVNHLDESAIPVYTPEPSGKNVKRLLVKMRELTKDHGQKPYTVTELRRIAQDIGMVKASAVSAVDTLINSPFMRPFGGAYVFTDGNN